MPDNSQSSDPIIRGAWERGLDALKPTPAQVDHGLELHEGLFTCDTFGFLPSVFTDEVVEAAKELVEANIGAEQFRWELGMVRGVAATRDPEGAETFTNAVAASGLNASVLTVAEGKSREEDIKRMAMNIHTCRVLRKRIAQAGSVDQIQEIADSGRTAVIWSINGPPIAGKLISMEEELSWIPTWYNLGVRLMHLTYNRRNFIADGCAEPANGGLSELGRDLVRELNRVGIIVDTPHSGRQTTLDAAALSEKPMMASHTGAEAVLNHMRCKSDEELKAIAATDGLIGVYVLPNMLGPDATLNTMLDHLDHIAKLVGTDHVSIGTDTTYQSEWPEDLATAGGGRFSGQWWGNWNAENHPIPGTDEASRGSLAWTNWPLYTVGLVTRGYSDEDIAKILGANFLRVLKANEPEAEVRL